MGRQSLVEYSTLTRGGSLWLKFRVFSLFSHLCNVYNEKALLYILLSNRLATCPLCILTLVLCCDECWGHYPKTNYYTGWEFGDFGGLRGRLLLLDEVFWACPISGRGFGADPDHTGELWALFSISIYSDRLDATRGCTTSFPLKSSTT